MGDHPHGPVGGTAQGRVHAVDGLADTGVYAIAVALVDQYVAQEPGGAGRGCRTHDGVDAAQGGRDRCARHPVQGAQLFAEPGPQSAVGPFFAAASESVVPVVLSVPAVPAVPAVSVVRPRPWVDPLGEGLGQRTASFRQECGIVGVAKPFGLGPLIGQVVDEPVRDGGVRCRGAPQAGVRGVRGRAQPGAYGTLHLRPPVVGRVPQAAAPGQPGARHDRGSGPSGE